MENLKLTKKTFSDLMKNVTNTRNIINLTNYVNTRTKVKFKCTICDHEWETSAYEVIVRGTGCPNCSKFKSINKSDTAELDLKIFNKYNIKNKYTYLSEYNGYTKPIKLRCNECNTEFEITPQSILSTRRCKMGRPPCPTCDFNERTKESNNLLGKNKFRPTFTGPITKTNYREALKINRGDEFEILSDYVNKDTKLKCRHTICNHIFEVGPYELIKRGSNCPKCSKIKVDLLNTKTIEDLQKDLINKYGKLNYKFNSPYIGTHSYINTTCLICNNTFDVRPNNLLFTAKNTHYCPYCNPGSSNSENEVLNYIKSISPNKLNILTNVRNIISKEIDVFIPSKNIAFEYNGLYWHREEKVGKDYHLNKTVECSQNGINLIHIFEDEWNDNVKQTILKSKIKYLINITNDTKTVFARKCYIEEIDSSYKSEFLKTNHIQGNDKSCINLGLWYKDGEDELLLAVMTFCKPRASLGQKSNNSVYDYELSRFAVDIEYHVPGAFSKLFAYFKKNYEWNKIITYADRRFSQGNVYIKNGFTHIRNSKPSYWYSKGNYIKYHRYNFRKQVLKDKFPAEYDEKLTEFQIMDKTPYFRVWDCGNMVFEYIK